MITPVNLSTVVAPSHCCRKAQHCALHVLESALLRRKVPEAYNKSNDFNLIQQKCHELHRILKAQTHLVKCPNIEGRFAQWSCHDFRSLQLATVSRSRSTKNWQELGAESGSSKWTLSFFKANYLYHLPAWLCDCLMLEEKFQKVPKHIRTQMVVGLGGDLPRHVFRSLAWAVAMPNTPTFPQTSLVMSWETTGPPLPMPTSSGNKALFLIIS